MSKTYKAVPLVPLRGTVIYPRVPSHLDIGRDRSILAVEAAMESDRLLTVITQMDESVENPTIDDLGKVGTIVEIKQKLRLPGGILRLMVEGIERIAVTKVDETEPFYRVSVEEQPSIYNEEVEMEAYRRFAQSKFVQWADETKGAKEQEVQHIVNIMDPSELADSIMVIMPTELKMRQSVLEELDVAQRLNMVIGVLNTELQISDLENNINNRVRQQMEKQQKSTS